MQKIQLLILYFFTINCIHFFNSNNQDTYNHNYTYNYNDTTKYNCSNTLHFKDSNTHVLLIPDNAIDYHFNFWFNHNVSFEIGMSQHFEYLSCPNMFCECPFDTNFDNSLANGLYEKHIIR